MDETLDIIAIYGIPALESEVHDPDIATIVDSTASISTAVTATSPRPRSITADVENLPRLEKTTSITSNNDGLSQLSPSISWTYNNLSNTSLPFSAVAGQSHSELTSSLAPLSNSSSLQRSLVANQTEAELLQYFVDNLASSFDLTDNSRHFRLNVPQHAILEPILLNAVCALSARHLARTEGRASSIAEIYHDRCLQHLIPILSDESSIFNENLLAATVILRCLEELDVPMSWASEGDLPTHLIGTSAFVAAQEGFARHGGLRLSAFWVALRQEIYIAFIQQRPVSQFQRVSDDDIVFGSSEEDIWANRVVLYCARIITHCFTSGQDWQRVQRHATLMHDLDPVSYTHLTLPTKRIV